MKYVGNRRNKKKSLKLYEPNFHLKEGVRIGLISMNKDLSYSDGTS